MKRYNYTISKFPNTGYNSAGVNRVGIYSEPNKLNLKPKDNTQK